MSAAIPGIVLAAGASRRMGRSKALLPLGASGLPFVRVICDTLTAAGVSPIVVVTRAELLESLAGVLPGTELVVNRDPERGQLSSLLAGLDVLGAPAAAMMTLVDLPLVPAGTVAALLATWDRTHAPLVRPLFRGAPRPSRHLRRCRCSMPCARLTSIWAPSPSSIGSSPTQ